LTLIGAGVLVVAGLTTLLTTNFLAGGQDVATASGYSHRIFPPVAGILSSVAFSPDGTALAAGATGGAGTGPKGVADGITYLWNVKTVKVIHRFSPGGGAEAFSPDGTMLATAGGPQNKGTYLWDVSTGDNIATLPDEHHASVDSVAFSADGRKLAANDVDGTAYVWKLPPGGKAPAKGPASVSPQPPAVASTALAFSPKGETLAVGASDGQVYLWNAQTYNNSGTLNDHGSGGVTSVAFSPNGQLLAAGETSGVTYVWNLASRRLITLPDPESFRIDSVAFSPDSHWLATGDDNGKTYLWNMRGRNPATKPAVTLPNPKSSATGRPAHRGLLSGLQPGRHHARHHRHQWPRLPVEGPRLAPGAPR
jgi:WD40 repeat protein